METDFEVLYHQAINSLSLIQSRCTELLLENRALRKEREEQELILARAVLRAHEKK